MRNRLAAAALACTALTTLTACRTTLQESPPPTPTFSSSPSASPSSNVIVIPTNWVKFSWAAAGISARLPSAPTKSTVVRYVRGIPVILRIALIKPSPGPIELGVAQLGSPVAAAAIADELKASVKTFATSTSTTVTGQRSAKFLGLPARKAILSKGTQNYELLVFQRDATHEVFLLALDGEVFKAVASTLRLP